MAAQAAASPREAEIARAKLDALPAPQTLDRDAILAMPDLRADVTSRRVWNPRLRVHVVMDADDPAYLDLVLDEEEGPLFRERVT